MITNPRERVPCGYTSGSIPESVLDFSHKPNYKEIEFDKWNEVYAIVRDDDEMWRINREFILRQKQLNKEFYFSHNPKDPKYATGFYKREIDLLTFSKNQGGLNGTIETIIEGKLWKIKF